MRIALALSGVIFMSNTTQTKENLLKLSESILDLIDNSSNLDDMEDYEEVKNCIAEMIAKKFSLDVEFTDEELGV